MSSSLQLQRALLLVLALSPVAQAWVTPSVSTRSSHSHSLAVGSISRRPTSVAAAVAAASRRPSRVVLSAEDSSDNEDDGDTRSTSFAKADQSLMDEADKKRMDEMGDFDLNADVRYCV
jgi:HAMP domain-containing protein